MIIIITAEITSMWIKKNNNDMMVKKNNNKDKFVDYIMHY